jgi:hypothetical protein
VPHRRQQRADPDRVAGRRGQPLAVAEPGLDRLHDLVQAQGARDVQLRGEADLGVDDAVGREVLGALRRDPVQRGSGLHDPHGVRERLEVALQRPRAPHASTNHSAERAGVRGGEPVVPLLGGELDDVCGP